MLIYFFSIPAKPQDFNAPESAAFDPIGKRYFVSNFGSGDISQIDSNGVKSCFKKDLSKTLGIILLNNILYLVENTNTIRGFDITDGSLKMKLQIDEAKFLNDITTDSTGFLYVTDSQMNKILKIEISSQKYTTLVNTNYDNLNGILFDKLSNRLIVCYFKENAVIQAVSLKDSIISTLVSDGLDNLDGIAEDNQGNIYVSSWKKGSFQNGFSEKGIIYKFEKLFIKEPIIIHCNHFGPADIFFNKRKNELVIPYLLDNIVEFMPMK
jgi:DNA-binding beta-propeller fold protein YncE